MNNWLYWFSGFFIGYSVGMFTHSWLRLREVRKSLNSFGVHEKEKLH